MKLLDKIRQRRQRPALIIAVALLAYFFLFSWPKIEGLYWDLRGEIFLMRKVDGGVFDFVFISYELIYYLAYLAIWTLSIFITWAAYSRSRKKAYLFILAYFLLPLVVKPVATAVEHSSLKDKIQKHWQDQQAQVQLMEPGPTEGEDEVSELKEASEKAVALPVEEHSVSFPLGDFLLLAGVWFLYKKEDVDDAAVKSA